MSFDYCTSLHKISSLLKTNYNGIPLSNGYINANKAKALVFKKAFFDNNFFKVGIFWQGNPNHLNDKNRSISLRFFYPITTISGVMVYSLQKKHGLEQLMSLPQEASIVNLDQYLHNFDDLAAAIVNLDLLISIDSSVAHLGGALGKTTWILLPKISDWRWFGYSEGDECCWYTHMKKFRQRHVGVWQDVFTDIINQIKQRVKKGT